MAEAAVVSAVLGKLAEVAAGGLLNKAHGLQGTVSGQIQIEQMQKELGLIQALLRDADSKRNRSDELVTEWLKQVREIADRINSVIDTFRRVQIEENRPESSNCTCFRKITTAVKRNYKTYKLGLREELEDITGQLDRILQRGTQLGIQDKLGAALDDPEPAEPSHDMVDDPQVVGFEDDKGNIINQLLDSSISRRMVLSIVGTGGLGKTTLAQKVYNSAELERQFHCRAWLSISQKYILNDLWREILYSIEPQMKNQDPPITDKDLPMKLKSSLRCKRYLIILDDVWDFDLWEELKKALPDPNNASRVIITSRSVDVAKAADCNTEPYKLRYLSDAEGLALLFRTAFQQHVQPENINYPRDLLEVAKRLTKKCGGLPLALVVVGGILTRRDRNYTAWNKLDETMDWHDKDGEKCMKILGRSYEDLPHHLKSCFLYFSAFPEDYKISGRHVIEMWMAEEFIPKVGGGTIEDRAEKCLEELVQRCLIQVSKKSWNGYCKYCNMHDLLRDLAITKAKEDNFFTVFSKSTEEGQDVNQLAAIKPRRAALQFCTIAQLQLDGVYSENIRSLLCFGFDRYPRNDDCGFSKLNYSGFSLLRVLTLQSVDMTKFTPRQWPKGLMIHLRYLGLRDCLIPQDIYKKLFSFSNLETIDLRGSEVELHGEMSIDLCDVVIPTLRHVYGGYWRLYLPLKWDQHTNLQTIENVSIQKELVVELGYCINLRTLVIGFDDVHDLDNERAVKDQWQNLKGVLRRTEQLVYLGISTNGVLPFGGTTDLLPCHGKIQKLVLDGEWEIDICVTSTVEMFPTNLTKLTLARSSLTEDLMPILERLQSLRILHLGPDSYVGTELICSTGGFPKLEKLKLSYLWNLCHWDIKEGAMPVLRHLIIQHCKKLDTLPELQKVRTLQELLVIGDPGRSKLRESMQGDKDLYKIKHIPSVRIV